MPVPDMSLVPPDILQRLRTVKPYCLVLLLKGSSHEAPEAKRIIQTEHLPYLFRLRDEGLVALSAPVLGDADLRAVAVYNTADEDAVRACLDEDPAVVAGVFRYHIYPVMALPGDRLG
jgi:hypothetical protein